MKFDYFLFEWNFKWLFFNNSILNIAVENNNIEIIKLLLENPNLNVNDKSVSFFKKFHIISN